jgi:hypothetical protein
MLAGHVASDFWQRGDGRWKVAAGVMALYVIVGMVELWGTTGALVFVLSPAVYLLAALRHTAAIEAVEDAEQAAENNAWQREQERIAAAREHEIRLRQMELRHKERLAKAREVSPKPAESATETPELSGKALEVYKLLSVKPGATNTEIGETVGVSRQYVGQVRRELNGHTNGKI